MFLLNGWDCSKQASQVGIDLTLCILHEREQLNHGISGRSGIINITQFPSVFDQETKEMKTNNVKMIQGIFSSLILLLVVKENKKISVSDDDR